MPRSLVVLVCWALSASVGQALSAGTRERGAAPDSTSSHLETVLVVPELKFLFTYIPKNACTQFNKLMDTMNGMPPADPPIWHHQLSSATRTFGWSHERLWARLRDRTWTKAVFLRDPLERLVSAWRNKCRYGAEQCKTPDGCPNCIDGDFEVAVGKLEATDDEHWIQQSRFGGGLPSSVGDYDFVGHLSQNYSSMHDQVVRMLRMVLARHSGKSRLNLQAFGQSCSGAADQELCIATLLADTHLTPSAEGDWHEAFFAGYRALHQAGKAQAAKDPSSAAGDVGDLADEYFPADHSPAVNPTGTAGGQEIFRPGSLDLALRYYREDYEGLPGLSVPQWALDMRPPWWFENSTQIRSLLGRPTSGLP